MPSLAARRRHWREADLMRVRFGATNSEALIEHIREGKFLDLCEEIEAGQPTDVSIPEGELARARMTVAADLLRSVGPCHPFLDGLSPAELTVAAGMAFARK